ncbi:MAG TPA: CDP-diacylglycerol--glycerol-3-phosphate 3-phosphatidyltransferase [Steroidobacteraceae bacterium]|jgi:CDP-diacylglycerol--glycerol-3-phosphate 3-phosphatidyltransferase/cardiolipin synthase|nr:CDP-diacylglycerol--glycerol-3-phosphate 3-phosphatidyltransferase [Steroidobacteraceae bacterium]
MIWNLPNLLTWLRILAIPLVVVLFLVGGHHPGSVAYPLAGVLFALAAITDSLDGYLARRLGQITRLGAFLDPVADKLIVAVALVLIVSRDPRALMVLTAAVIIGREIAISALREWMAEIGQRTAVAVSRIGKLKTILQMVGLTLLLFRADLGPLPIYLIGQWLTVVAALLTLISMALYLRSAWPYLRASG